jgi:hypothetical protein
VSGPDLAATVSRRLATRCTDADWLGACVRVVEPRGGGGVATPPHYLAAAWAPGAPRSRWPEAVVIGSPAADNALAQLLPHLPPDAKLYLAGLDEVDAALAARILLAADRNLERYQRDGVEAFVASEEARLAARIAAAYTDRDEGFERFRARVFAPPSSAR